MTSPGGAYTFYDARPRWACCGGFCDDTHAVTCPVLAKDEPYIAEMLEGIGRQLELWRQNPTEHRCYSRFASGDDIFDEAKHMPVCSCGSRSLLHVAGQRIELENAFDYAFGRDFFETGWEYDDDDLGESERDDDDDVLHDRCVLGAACLVADPYHSADECFDVEMAEAMFGEDRS